MLLKLIRLLIFCWLSKRTLGAPVQLLNSTEHLANVSTAAVEQDNEIPSSSLKARENAEIMRKVDLRGMADDRSRSTVAPPRVANHTGNETGEYVDIIWTPNGSASSKTANASGHRRPKALLTWLGMLFGNKEPKPEKEYFFPDKKSVPIRAQVTLHPSESWTNLMMSFHPSRLPPPTKLPDVSNQTQAPETNPDKTKEPLVTPVEVQYYPVEIEIPSIPWYPHYPPQPPSHPHHHWDSNGVYYYEGTFSGTQQGNEGVRGQAQNNGPSLQPGVPYASTGTGIPYWDGNGINQWNGHGNQQQFTGGHQVQGQIKVTEDSQEQQNFQLLNQGHSHGHGSWDQYTGQGTGAHYGYRPPSHPHKAAQQKRSSEPDSGPRQEPHYVRRPGGYLVKDDSGLYHYHVQVPTNGRGPKKIRVHLPPGISKDKVVINVHPVFIPPPPPPAAGRHQPLPVPIGSDPASVADQPPVAGAQRQQPLQEKSETVPINPTEPRRPAFLQDPAYLQRIFGPAILHRPPTAQILVPKGPAGEEMEARLLAARRNDEEAVLTAPIPNAQLTPEQENLLKQLYPNQFPSSFNQQSAGLPQLEGGFDPTKDFNHFPEDSFNQQAFLSETPQDSQDRLSQGSTLFGEAPREVPETTIVDHLVPPSPLEGGEREAHDEGFVGKTGPGVTSKKEEVKKQEKTKDVSGHEEIKHADESDRIVETHGASKPQNAQIFTSYPGRPNENWGQSYTGLRYPPYDDTSLPVLSNQNAAHVPRIPTQSQVLIHSQSSVSKNNHVGQRQG